MSMMRPPTPIVEGRLREARQDEDSLNQVPPLAGYNLFLSDAKAVSGRWTSLPTWGGFWVPRKHSVGVSTPMRTVLSCTRMTDTAIAATKSFFIHRGTA
jgi:hypothetical protein